MYTEPSPKFAPRLAKLALRKLIERGKLDISRPNVLVGDKGIVSEDFREFNTQ